MQSAPAVSEYGCKPIETCETKGYSTAFGTLRSASKSIDSENPIARCGGHEAKQYPTGYRGKNYSGSSYKSKHHRYS